MTLWKNLNELLGQPRNTIAAVAIAFLSCQGATNTQWEKVLSLTDDVGEAG